MTSSLFKARPMALALATLFSSGSIFIATTAQANDLPPLVVTGQTTHGLTITLSPSKSQRMTADTGEWLSQQSGVATNRMGGHGLDPIIRGLGQNRLNILLDGAYVFGGCPNRMDPPTAYAPLTSYDLVTISKGVTTLRHGAGGSGGSVVFERLQPDFSGDNPAISGQLGSSYNSNGKAGKGWGNVLTGGEQGYLRAFGEYSKGRDYKDGAGRKIWSGYETTQGGGALGWTPNVDSWLEVSYEETRERDIRFAGAGMDSPISDNKTYGLRGRYDLTPLLTLTGNLNYSQVEHLMDNLSRPAAMMKMAVPTTSDTLSGRLMAEYQLGANQFTGGINLLENKRSATMLSAPNTAPKAMAFMWPDVTQRQVGAFAEVEHHLGATRRVATGIRADYFESKADLATSQPAGGAAPAMIYQSTYGISGDVARDQWLTGAFMRFEQDLGAWQRAFVSVSRSQRMGDATEMYMARGNWVGNPDLKPETSHQIDLGLLGKSASLDYSAVVFSNQVTDYIYRDVDASNKSTYRNIKAALYGLELDSTLRYASNWETRGQLNLLRGDNRSDGGTLAQITPYSGQLSQHWINANWEVATTLRFADKADRLNTDADEKATAGYGLVDLSLAWKPIKELEVSTGINNLLDKNYANFLNRNAAGSDPLNSGANALVGTLTEPGRSFWVSGNYRF